MFFALLVVAGLPALLWLTARRTQRERFHAKIAYAEARGRFEGRGEQYTDTELLSEVCHVYIEKYGWNASGKALRQFLVRWQKEHPEEGTRGAHRPGRPQHMIDAECAQCISKLRAGHVVDGKFRLYKTLSEAAEFCPTVATCRARYTPHDESGMWRRLTAYDKDLIRVKTRCVRSMRPQVREQRVNASPSFEEKGLDNAMDEFFIDEKTVLMHPKAGHAIGYRKDRLGFIVETDDITYHDRIAHKNDLIKVKFYSMVNYCACMCGFYASQSGARAPVLTGSCTPPIQLRCHPQHGLPDLGVAGGRLVLCEHHMT